ncbi:hypothetical protein K438DRAFT_1754747 [Mycena galopus ATCC 62051]|nr:hypothetical protein K438DRAFT_1754747 [Mycena galopus ATCC 62051]
MHMPLFELSNLFPGTIRSLLFLAALFLVQEEIQRSHTYIWWVWGNSITSGGQTGTAAAQVVGQWGCKRRSPRSTVLYGYVLKGLNQGIPPIRGTEAPSATQERKEKFVSDGTLWTGITIPEGKQRDSQRKGRQKHLPD